ncbi:MAG TPA: response regulator [Candidatus Hydrogenedentes bacterium]|nr:response regulator [Candidatus Hydrogenedentota bacterium]
MASSKSRVGIERKILSTILWVGVLPIAVVLVMGYIIARGSQSKTVKESLLNSVQKTAQGIQIESSARMRFAENLAADDYVIHAVSQYEEDKVSVPFAPLDDSMLRAWLDRYRRVDSSAPTSIAIYNRDRTLLLATPGLTIAKPPSDDILKDAQSAAFDSFRPDVENSLIFATVVAPIYSPAKEELIGYVSIEAQINSLLEYVMGAPALDNGKRATNDVYQILYLLGGAVVTVQGEIGSSLEGIPGLARIRTSDVLESYLLQNRNKGALSIPEYIWVDGKPKLNAMVAYQRLSDLTLTNADAYVLVYHPTAPLFSSINKNVLLLSIGCLIFIGILCINAYREVHNNIVRPVSLLNEGAQIVRQGDFDLKLKIETGDEIEELAMSFNKMAIALKSNIKQLEDSEEKYRHLVTALRDGIYQTDIDGKLTFLNQTGSTIFGFSSIDHALGTPITDFFDSDVDFDPLSLSIHLIEGDDRTRMWLKPQEGEEICVEITRKRMFNEDGIPIGLEGIIRDITKSVRLEDEARLRSERISAINQIANVINSSLEAGRLYESLVGELQKLLDFDYAAVALLSDSGDFFDGRQLWPDHEVSPGYTFALDIEDSCAAWVARERECLVVDDLQKDTAPFASQFPETTNSCLCVPLYATGRIIGTLNLGTQKSNAFTSQDVEAIQQMAPHLAVAIRNAQLLTNLQLSLEEVTRAREKLHEVNDELKSLDEMKTNLLSNVSHELRTPLVSVMGYTDMILNAEAGPINGVQKEYLEISLRNIEKLVTLIENLLDFSRLHRGDERLVFDQFDLKECAKSSMEIIQPLSDSRQIKVDLIAPDTPVWVDGDKGKMGQVFNNLLSNAVKFNDNGGLVTIELKLMHRSVEVVVQDTGIGIPEEALDKVFTRFYQYDGSSTRKYGGTGIGLSIAQDIVRLHGNTITASSESGKGTTFRFTLSLSASHIEKSNGDVREESAAKELHTLVELVTLDRALSMQIRDILTSEGMDMIHASTPKAALALAHRHHPDCILIDMSPSETFHDVITELSAEESETNPPIILLTNDDDVYHKYASVVDTRVKRNFRKNSLLSGISHALTEDYESGPPVGHKILCVDDDPEILTFVSRCLDTEGYETELCATGEEALERVKSGDFGLVLLDISMPGMDGWETSYRIKSEPALRGIKVYMVTAKPIEQNGSGMKDSKADGFLLKPFRPEDLLQLVQSLELKTPAH